MKTDKEKIKIPLLVPLVLAIIILLVVSIFSIGWLQQRNITEEVKKCRDSVQTLFYEHLKENSRLMNGLIDFLKEDKQLQNAWQTKDRDLLLSYAKPFFENLSSKYKVTHFYFHDLDRVCFLRVHEPSRHGDYIDRFTMDRAVREGKPVYGIELGPLGTFTLRVVYPWWIDDKLVGYIELGEEIEHLTQGIKDILNVELSVAINKSYLNRAKWEEGMKILGHKANWDMIPKFAIVDCTFHCAFNKIPAEIMQNRTPDDIRHKDLLPEIKINDRNYRTGFVALIDAGGRDVGDIIVMKDITERQASLRTLTAILAAINAVIGIVLFTLFYFYINHIEHKLITSHVKLKTEIKEHEKTEEKLRHSYDELEIRVQERTHDLAEANKQWEETFNSINDAITIHDKDYNIIRANKASEQMLNSPLSEIISRKCYKIYHGCTCPPEGCPSCKILKTGKPCEFEILEPHLNKFVEIKGMPRFDERGEMVGMIHVVRDITDRKQKEKELKEIQEDLVSASHRAGMAEVATDVLHNVGNVLNSVNVSTTMIGELLSGSKIQNLKKVIDIIETHTHDLGMFLAEDPQGKHIPAYLIKIAKLLTDEQAEITKELHSLSENVEHIKEIVKMQQSYSKVLGVEAPTSLAEIIENAIQINSTGLKRHGVNFVREFAELPEVIIDKQRVLQILVNLINNAKYAVSQNPKSEKLLTVRFYKHSEDHLRIEVVDNGVGISKENLTKIFRHGFTTKKDGHGFGLHSCALAAKELGGSLTAYSDGPQQGATFILELPFKPVGVTV